MDTASAVIAAAFGMWVLEQWRPGQPLPDSRHWWSRMLLLNLVQLAVALLGARTWDHAFCKSITACCPTRCSATC